MDRTDAELVARVLEGDDRRAFAELVRRHQSSVRGLLRRLTAGDAAAADDLAQETFLAAYRSLRAWRGDGALGAWLYRIAYHRWLSLARRAPAPEPPAPAPGTALDAGAIARHDLERALAQLRHEERAALALAYGREVSHEEAAAILDWPVGTLKTHVLRGKARLRQLLGAGGAP